MKAGFGNFLRQMAAKRLEYVGVSLQGNEEYRAANARRGSADEMEADEMEADEATGEVMFLQSEESYIQGLRDGMALGGFLCEGSEKQEQVAPG